MPDAKIPPPLCRVKKRHELGPSELKASPTAKVQPDVNIDITGNVTIGDKAEIYSGVWIFTHKHDWSRKGPRAEIQKIIRKDITIGEDAYIGLNAIIICSSVGNGAVVGAGSVVTHDVPDNEVWAGVPAKCIKRRE
jgi:acetyltransferase-like isoleucine patch superfamily enzyme